MGNSNEPSVDVRSTRTESSELSLTSVKVTVNGILVLMTATTSLSSKSSTYSHSYSGSDIESFTFVEEGMLLIIFCTGNSESALIASIEKMKVVIL